MKPIRDIRDAHRRLRGMVAADSEPVLTDDEVMDLLADHQIAKPWSTGLVVQVGELIAPTTPTGWLYECVPGRDQDGIPGGTTGATEPRWPLDYRWPSREPVIVDDGTVRYRIHGKETGGLWNLKAAAHEGWMLKASKTAGEYAISTEAGGMHPEQVHEQCLKMAERYHPVVIR